MRSLVVLLLLGLGSSARADAPEEAKAHFKQGKAFHDAGAFAEAAEEFKAAYALDPKNELLYNIAQSLRLAGDKHEALEYYRKYLAAEPNGRGADDARRQVAALTTDLKSEEPPPAPAVPIRMAVPNPVPVPVPVPVPSSPPPPEPRRPRTLTWIAAASAVALLAGGTVMWIATDRAYDDYQMATTDAAWQDQRDRVESRQTWTRVLLGAAGAASVTAGVFYVMEF